MISKGLQAVTLSSLTIEDEASFRHIGLFGDLRGILESARYEFLVPADGSVMAWDRALFLNLTFWDEKDPRDVLCDAELPADVLMHVAWHHLGHRFLPASPEAELLSESIASAFDLYLVGRVLGHAPESTFLATQVPQMRDVAEAFGIDDDAFEKLLGDVAADPDRAFEDLRALLFTVTTRLIDVVDPTRACEVLASLENHRFAPLLHHYELSTWITKARLQKAISKAAKSETRPSANEVDELLRGATSSIDWLETQWVRRAENLNEGALTRDT